MMKRFVAVALLTAAAGLTVWLITGSAHRGDVASSADRPRKPFGVRPSAPRAPTAAAPQASPSLPAGETVSANRQPAQGPADKADISLSAPAPDSRAAQDRKDAHLRPYRTGFALRLGESDFELLNLRAVPAGDYHAGMGPAAFEKMNYVFVAKSAQPFAVGEGFPVLVKRSNGMVSVVTGTVVVTLKDEGRARAVADGHALELKGTDADVHAAFYAPADPSRSLADVLAALKGDPDVAGATLEIVQSRKRF